MCQQSSNATFFPVTVGFFDDIDIPTAYLPQPNVLYVILSVLIAPSKLAIRMSTVISGSQTQPLQQVDTPVAERMYIQRDEVVRVRVESDEFYDDGPGPPKQTEGVQVKKEPKRAPYTVCVHTHSICC